MKKIGLFFILLFFFMANGFSQEKEELFILLDYWNIRLVSGYDYKASFSLKSKDPRFDRDSYIFYIVNKQPFEEIPLYDLGQYVNLDTINYIKPEYYESHPPCQTHIELSLAKRIRVISKIPKDKLLELKDEKSEYMIWYVFYYGTVKDWVYTDMGQKD